MLAVVPSLSTCCLVDLSGNLVDLPGQHGVMALCQGLCRVQSSEKVQQHHQNTSVTQAREHSGALGHLGYSKELFLVGAGLARLLLCSTKNNTFSHKVTSSSNSTSALLMQNHAKPSAWNRTKTHTGASNIQTARSEF